MCGSRAPVVMLVGVGALALGSLGAGAAGLRPARSERQAVRLPAPITIAAGRSLDSVRYRIGRDGRIERIAPGRGACRWDGAGLSPASVWFRFWRSHLVVGCGHTQLWRSRGVFPESNRDAARQVGPISVGRHALAFSYNNMLYLAPLGGAERPIAPGEGPIGWTRRGLYTYRDRGHQLVFRGVHGRAREVLARGEFDDVYNPRSGYLYFLSHHMLMRARGAHVRELASLASLGLKAWPPPLLQPAGRLLELTDWKRLVVVRPNGAVFASTKLPREHGQAGGFASFLAVARHATAVAFTATTGNLQGRGVETVYVLRAGGEAAVAVHRERVQFNPCAYWTTLQWHRSWLLYGDSEGLLAAIDTAGTHHAVELRGMIKRLPGTRGGFSAYWSGQPTRKYW